MNVSKFDTTIAGRDRRVVVLDSFITEAPPSKPVHHVFVLDRSGSMYGHINMLMDQVSGCLAAMPDKDVVTIIWYSSSGQREIVCQLADPKLLLIIDVLKSLRSTVGATCFSEPMGLVRTVLDITQMSQYQAIVTLFSDGHPVVPWSITEELQRTMEAAVSVSTIATAINTIGYGPYYNEEFLRSISGVSKFGKLYHSNDLSLFSTTHNHGATMVRDMVGESITISADAEILVTDHSGLSTIYHKEAVITPSQGTRVFVVSDKAVLIHVGPTPVITDGVPKRRKKTDEELHQRFFRYYAFEKYYGGDRHTALSIVSRNLRDKAFIEQHLSSFTRDEVGAYMDVLRKSAMEPTLRYSKGVSRPNHVPKDDAPCVLDLLQTLADGGAKYAPFHPDVSAYQRIGVKKVDDYDVFTPEPGVVWSSMSGLVFNSSGQINVSIRFQVPGTVKLNPRSAERNQLPETFPTFIWRNHAFIKDGSLNVQEAMFKVDAPTLEKLSTFGPHMKTVSMDAEGLTQILVSFTKLPLINKTYISSLNAQDVYALVHNNLKLTAIQKLMSSMVPPRSLPPKYNEDQQACLRDHGITPDGSYGGVKWLTDSSEQDQYVAKHLEFRLRGCSSLPSVKDVLDYNRLKDNYAARIMRIAIDVIQTDFGVTVVNGSLQDSRGQIDTMLRNIRRELQDNRTLLNRTMYGAVLTGGWISGLKIDDTFDPGDGRPIMEVRTEVRMMPFSK